MTHKTKCVVLRQYGRQRFGNNGSGGTGIDFIGINLCTVRQLPTGRPVGIRIDYPVNAGVDIPKRIREVQYDIRYKYDIKNKKAL